MRRRENENLVLPWLSLSLWLPPSSLLDSASASPVTPITPISKMTTDETEAPVYPGVVHTPSHRVHYRRPQQRPHFSENDTHNNTSSPVREVHHDEQDGGDENAVDEIPVASWQERFRAEIYPCQPWFLKKHPEHDRPIDIASSFGPLGLKILFFKLFGTGFVMGTAIYSFVTDTDDRHWWLAYSTNWVLFIGSIYMVLSLLLTLFGAPQPYKRVSSTLVQSAWLLFSWAAHFSFLNAVFWWIYVYERGTTSLDWLNFVPHGILPFTISLDGLNVNRIPLRWQHYTGFVIPLEVLYVFWTYSQDVLGDFSNPDTGDGTIYGAYNWDDKGVEPLIMSLVGVFGVGPFIWFILWLFSQYWLICCCLGDRRLYYEDPRKKRKGGEGGMVEGVGLFVKSYDSEEEFIPGKEEGNANGVLADDEERKSEYGDEEEGSSRGRKYQNRWQELANAD